MTTIYRAEGYTIRDVINLLEMVGRERGYDIPICVYDHEGRARENIIVYLGNIATDLRSEGAEVSY